MKGLKKAGSFLIIAVMLAVQAIPVFANETVQIDVISFNDFHGAISAPSDTDKNMGAAKFTQALLDKVAENPNTIVVSAGDNYNGSATSNLLYGKPVNDMLKEIGIVASAVGNHEFDWGVDKIPTWIQDMGAPFVAANVVNKANGQIPSWAVPYVITEVADINVAFIGLATQETAYKASPALVAGFDFLDYVETAAKYVPEVKEAGADIVILLTHIGSEQDGDTVNLEADAVGLTEIEGVDAIITGHYHNTVAGFANGVPVVQAYYNGRAVSTLAFEVNAETKEIISVTPSTELLYERKAEVSENEAIAAKMAAYEEEVGPILSEVIGYTENGLHHERWVGPTVLGQWASEQMRLATGADVAFQNDGGLRVEIAAGEITMGNLYEVMPFDNVLATVEMTGASIQKVLEHGIENEVIGPVQMSGFSKVEYTKDADGNIVVLEMVLADGTPVEADAVYKAVTNDFMASGGDDFTAFLEGNFLGESTAIRDCLVDAISAVDVIDYEMVDVLVYTENAETAEVVEEAVETEEIEAVEEAVETEEVEAVEEAVEVEVVEEIVTADGTVYTVIKNDNLYKIAVKFYEDGAQWNKIYEANKSIIANPNLIFIGQELLIP